ncbi:MAG TPA: SRPBCC family protein [Ilumatobacter sp.]
MAQLPIRQPEWIPAAPVVVRRERHVDAPASAVWRHIADHETWPEWFPGLKRVEVPGSREGVGGQRLVSVPGATVGEVFTAWDPDARFAFAVVAAPRVLASMAESVVIAADGDSCDVTYTIGIEPATGFGWFWRLAAGRMARMLERALVNLAERAEREPA